MAPGSEVVGLGSLQRLPGDAERGHCWASYQLRPSVVRWYAWPQGAVGASFGDPQPNPVAGAADGGVAAEGKCLSDG